MARKGLSAIVRMSPSQTLGLGLVVIGAILLVLAYDAQAGIDKIGATNDPVLQDRVAMYENQRDLYVVSGIGALFIGLFAMAILGEPGLPRWFSSATMVSSARVAGGTLEGLSLKGSACYLPAKHGLTKERMFAPATEGASTPPSALSDDLVMSPGKDGSSPGMLFEPLGLELLAHVERELNTSVADAGIEAAEGTLQMLKHGMGLMSDFHFKERDGKTVLRVEYSGLDDACRTVRKERPNTCRQFACAGCSCLLTAAAKATGKLVIVEGVDNGKDTVVFTLRLEEW
ncbi:MAG: hypothetical protein MUC90_06495 [Thermoplasmata archaeon]|nr:hypothetical protein [Thermoplasmata archaeon]